MKSVVLFDSFFGNTERIARAIAAGLERRGTVEVTRIGEVKPDQLQGIDLLVVGSPTRGFQPSPATKTFLKSLPAGSLKGVRVAAFDTRIDPADTNSAILKFLVRFFGYAAQPIAKLLASKGGSAALAPEGFFVKASEGPLKDGEIERAQAWGISIS